MKDFYYILGTDINSTSIEISEAYSRLVKKIQPELNRNDSYIENHFKDICEAYETLRDPAKRGKYDAALKRSKSKSPGYSKTKRTDITFTIILILLTGLFGYYVVKSVSGAKPVKAAKPVFAAAVHPVKHHKKKHIIPVVAGRVPEPIIKTAVEPPKITAPDTPAIHKAQKAAPVPEKIIEPKENPSTYVTYIHSNATGVVYLRRLDDYTSAIVKVIPTNSKVTVLEKGARYYKISFDNETGYVPKWAVQTK